jgi:hypothetical protein
MGELGDDEEDCGGGMVAPTGTVERNGENLQDDEMKGGASSAAADDAPSSEIYAPEAASDPRRALESALLAASQPWGTALEHMLAGAHSPPQSFHPGLRGAVLRVDLEEMTVWCMGPAEAALQPALRSVTGAAARYETFGIWLVRSRDGEKDGLCVAWGHACMAAPVDALLREAVSALAPLPDAMASAWGPPGAAAASSWGTLPQSSLLPPLRDLLSRYRAIVARVAEEEAEAGQAGRRTAASLDMRAAAMVLSEHLRRQLADPARANLPAALYRRLVNRATAGLMHPGAKEDKPEWFDLEGIVKKAGWTRRTRQSPGYGIDGRWPHRVAEPGKIQYLDPNGLLRAYEATLGGRVADDSVVWTICAEVAGHTPTVAPLAPHLQDLIDQAQQEGHPLWLYDNTTKMAPMAGETLAGKVFFPGVTGFLRRF